MVAKCLVPSSKSGQAGRERLQPFAKMQRNRSRKLQRGEKKCTVQSGALERSLRDKCSGLEGDSPRRLVSLSGAGAVGEGGPTVSGRSARVSTHGISPQCAVCEILPCVPREEIANCQILFAFLVC